MSAKKLKHPADGLYTFSAKRARELGACDEHLDAWVRRHGQKVVPVTLADMSKQERAGGAVVWCLLNMKYLGRLSGEETTRALRHYWEVSSTDDTARVLMDALLVRAKREGRIP